MAEIRPFKGIRYNQAKVGDISEVVTPPYDVISPEEQAWYFGKHPNSFIRLILPKEDPSNPSLTKYDRAGACLREWLESGILVQDDVPSIYAYEQEYEIFGEWKRRLGFTCTIRLEDYENRKVLPHENILAKPKDDRLCLMRATGANFDSVFGLHGSAEVEDILRPFITCNPDAKAVDKDGVISSLWIISDPDAINAIAESLADESVLIADGHHRYAAALGYRDEMRSQADTPDPNAPYEFVMMTLVSLEDKGLVILPTHRLVRNLENFDADEFVTRLSDFFYTEETPADKLMEAVECAETNHVFGMYLGGEKSYVITLKPVINPANVITSPGSDALKQLDVSVLHSLIMEKFLGIGAQQMSAQSNLSYKRDPAEALKLVDEGEYQIAFLMNPTKVDEVKEVAAAGDKMPQKSTYFFPKLLTGILMRKM